MNFHINGARFFTLFFVLSHYVLIASGQQPATSSRDSYSSLEARLQEMSARYQKIFSPLASPVSAGASSVSPVVREGRSAGVDQAQGSNRLQLSSEGERVDSLEDSRGSYYLLPFVSLAIPSSVTLDLPAGAQSKIETEVGYAMGFNLGRRWGNWIGEIHFDYGKVEFGNYSAAELIVPATGESEIMVIGARFGHGLPLGEKGFLRMGLGVGFGSREDTVVPARDVDPVSSDHSVFTYDASLGLGYAFSENFSGHLGYRFLGTNNNENFGPLRNHLVELALGADF